MLFVAAYMERIKNLHYGMLEEFRIELEDFVKLRSTTRHMETMHDPFAYMCLVVPFCDDAF